VSPRPRAAGVREDISRRPAGRTPAPHRTWADAHARLLSHRSTAL